MGHRRNVWRRYPIAVTSAALVAGSMAALARPGTARASEPAPAFSASWGSAGTGDGQFSAPVDIALAPDGTVYVADAQNNRVQHFTADGGFLGTFGSGGSGDGQFNFPNGLAVAPSGDIYVADSNNHRVEKFDSSGTFVTAWGTLGSSDGQFLFAFSVAVDSHEDVYVTDGGNNRVEKFDATGAFLGKWGTAGSGDGQFQTPYDIAIDGADNVFVTERSGNRVQKFDSSGTFLTTWGSGGTGDGQFQSPLGVGVDAVSNVFVGDSDNNRVQKFDATGALLTEWGSYGTGAGQFAGPRGIAAGPDGSVFVVDTGNDRIEKFASPTYAINVSKTGTGAGGVTSSPAGIECGSTCSASFAVDTSVTLTATPDSGSTFAGWTGDCVGTGTCSVTMTQARSVSAEFDASNQPPVASNGSTLVPPGTSSALPLLATDADGDPLVFSIVTPPAHGTVSLTGNVATYTPARNYIGSDGFTFRASDGTFFSNTATESIVVNSKPLIQDQSVVDRSGSPISVRLPAIDGDGDPLTYRITGGPAHGSVTGTGPGVTYTPATGYAGQDSFTWVANDGHYDSSTAIVDLCDGRTCKQSRTLRKFH